MNKQMRRLLPLRRGRRISLAFNDISYIKR